ncbi:transposase [Paraburkholderia sp. EB58]|uniref:transposase n=1 Tax=Paraburkholderia sp. EB58 TaxID=3035125 RepID=UPI003D22C5C5
MFSSLRSQQGLNRFRRRGLQAVKREFALHVLAHNLSRAVALSRALFTLLYGFTRPPRGRAMFSGQISSICWLAPAITSTPGLQLDAQQKCFATASSRGGGYQRH